MSIMDTLHQDRDKVLLFLMFVLLLFAAIHFVHHAADSRVLDWTPDTPNPRPGYRSPLRTTGGKLKAILKAIQETHA